MNKLLKLSAAAALFSSSALYGQIEINPNLTITGFLDMSAAYIDDDDGTSSNYDLDQMELDFIYSFDRITAQVDIDHERGQNGIELEQGFLTYDLGEGASLTAGKFLSYHGWETAEPTGLYQYSYAYEDTLRPYHNGVSFDYTDTWGGFGIALLDSVYDDDGSLGTGGDVETGFEGDEYEYGMEAKLVLTPVEGLTLYLGYGLDVADTGDLINLDDRELINFWTSYEFGINTLAFEYNDFSNTVADIEQWLVMWSAAVSDTGTVTVRLSNDKRDYAFPGAAGSGQAVDEDFKYTLAYIHTVTDNLALISEVSYTDMGSWRGSETLAAVEALLTF